ncbi:hypothetical protein G7Z17_g2324 [Cylindrodendrum hubeiense]|uniref:Uncharacterized protein n=1 Tax=Cylindrodendrum hubeiense TaxID=595255 RepID=A0A9P5HD61_9HYPO|nr:hypothetical protein G7Z17_g2324 [Cylindrodendrum hubeiense]
MLALDTAQPRATEVVKAPGVSVHPGMNLDEEEIREAAKWKRINSVMGDRDGARKRQGILDTFLGFQNLGLDAEHAVRFIDTNAPREMLTSPERFYRNPLKVLYRQTSYG